MYFFLPDGYRQIFCHFKTSSYLKNTGAGNAARQKTCPRFPQPSSEQQRLVAFSLLPRSCRTEFLGRFSLPLDLARIGGKIGPAAGSRDSGPPATHELYFFATFRKILTETPKSLGSPVFLVKYCKVLASSAKTFDLKLGVHYT